MDWISRLTEPKKQIAEERKKIFECPAEEDDDPAVY